MLNRNPCTASQCVVGNHSYACLIRHRSYGWLDNRSKQRIRAGVVSSTYPYEESIIIRNELWLGLLAFLVVGCGGGSSAVIPSTSVAQAPSSQPAATNIVTLSSTQSSSITLPTINGISASLTFPAGTGVLSISSSSASAASSAAMLRSKASTGTLNVYYIVQIVSQGNITLSVIPSFTLTLPSTIPTAGNSFYYALSQPNPATPGQAFTTEGPATISGSTVTFDQMAGPITFTAGQSYTFAFYSTSTNGSGGTAGPHIYSMLATGGVGVVSADSTGTATLTYQIPAPATTSPLNNFPYGTSPAVYRSAPSLAVDATGTVYVPAGNEVDVFAPNQSTVERTLNVPATAKSVSVSTAGIVYVLGANLPFQASGAVYAYPPGATSPSTTITNGPLGPYENGVVDNNELAIDAVGDLYLSTSIDNARTFGQLFLGVFDIQFNGHPPFNVTPGYAASGDPDTLAVSADDHTLYVSDGSSNIQVYTGGFSGFQLTGLITNPPNASCESLALGADGTLYELEGFPNAAQQIAVYPAGSGSGAVATRTFQLPFVSGHIAVGP